MRICRFSKGDATVTGRVEGNKIHVCGGSPLSPGDPSGEVVPLADVRLLAPLVPGKIIGIGRNYADHAREFGNVAPTEEPMIFLKPPSSILSPGQTILMPAVSQRVDHEAELGVVIGRRASRLPEDVDPLAYVLGYTCVNDVTARDLQKKDVQFTRAKGFDTFCPMGPWIETELDPDHSVVEARVNGQIRQSASTANMIFPVAFLVRYLSHVMTLEPGDLIASGTPAGVGPLAAGDLVEVEVSGVGTLSNPVAARS